MSSDDDLRFVAPQEVHGADRLDIIIQRGPAGELIVDMRSSNNRSRRDIVHSEVFRHLMQLTEDVRTIARQHPGPASPAIEKLAKAVELLAALLVAAA